MFSLGGVVIRAIDESNLEDEVRLCLPSPESPKYAHFDLEKSVSDKVAWLRNKLKDYGYVGHIAYNNNHKVLGFVEFISSKGAPVPIEETETTAIITCIDLHAPRGQGIGTNLLNATLRQLWKIGVCQVKTVVSRSPRWINNGIYRKHGFKLEKTFYKVGNPEPFDLLTLRLDGHQPEIEAVTEHLRPSGGNALPVEVVYFHSAQCPESSGWVRGNHVNAVAKFSKDLATLKIIDAWKEPALAKRYGSMYFFDTFINGRCPFFGPPAQADIENEIQREINRIRQFRQ